MHGPMNVNLRNILNRNIRRHNKETINNLIRETYSTVQRGS